MHPATTPSYVIDAIPGAKELADAYQAARRESAAKAQRVRETGTRAAQLTSGHIRDPRSKPAPGVAKSDWDNALDAYRVASDDANAAERELERAAHAFSRHVTAGISTEAFKARHAEIAEAANEDARAALAKLKTSLTTRDEINRLTGRRITMHTWYGIDAALKDVTDYINAHPSTTSYFYDTAIERLNEAICTADEKLARLETIRSIDALDISDVEKFRRLKTSAGL